MSSEPRSVRARTACPSRGSLFLHTYPCMARSTVGRYCDAWRTSTSSRAPLAWCAEAVRQNLQQSPPASLARFLGGTIVSVCATVDISRICTFSSEARDKRSSTSDRWPATRTQTVELRPKRVVSTALTRYPALISSVNASWFIALSTASSSRCISDAKVSSLRRTSAASMP